MVMWSSDKITVPVAVAVAARLRRRLNIVCCKNALSRRSRQGALASLGLHLLHYELPGHTYWPATADRILSCVTSTEMKGRNMGEAG